MKRTMFITVIAGSLLFCGAAAFLIIRCLKYRKACSENYTEHAGEESDTGICADDSEETEV